MKLALFVILSVLLLVLVITYEVLRLVPVVELRRRARADRSFHNLYQAASFGPSLDLVLGLVISAGALVLVIWLYKTAWWLALLAVWLGWALSRLSLPAWSWRLAAIVSPPLIKVLSWLRPLTRHIAKVWPSPKVHSRLYEREDLLELLEQQKIQADSRLSEAELKTARGALEFTDKKVSDVMTPRSKLKTVKADESIGPHLMDELHASGQQRFAVVKELTKTGGDNIVGGLYLQDLLERPAGGQVSDVMHEGTHFVGGSSDLRNALAEFLKTKSHLLIVINDFDEVVGALTTETVFEQILGQPVADHDADLSLNAQTQSQKDDSQDSESAKPDLDS